MALRRIIAAIATQLAMAHLIIDDQIELDDEGRYLGGV
jgi:hypothetical protein